MADEHAFLPNARTALAANAAAPPGGVGRRRVVLGIRPLANGAAQGDPVTNFSAELRGAGDVVAIDSRAIARVDPEPGARAFEPDYFPYVDFRDPDYAWRESLDVTTGPRVKPWLCLIALHSGEFVRLDRGIAPLPRIVVTHVASSLPDLEQSWAFAHVQVNRFGTSVEAALADPKAAFSRLLCTRRLKESTAYSLMLVPVFEAGRLRGLGAPADVDPYDALAWDAASTGTVELPVLREWAFTTSVSEDFESLIRRLKPLDDPDSVDSTRNVAGGTPGFYPVRDDSVRIEMEGALRTPGFEREIDLIQTHVFTPLLEETLTSVIRSREDPEGGPAPDGPDFDDPLVALPVYGRHYARPSSIDAGSSENPWVHELNLDLRSRTAAGVGSRIVKRHQERLVHSVWQQLGAIREANRLIARLEAANRVGARIVDRHIKSLPPSVALQVAEPMLDLVAMPGTASRSIGGALDALGVPKGARHHALRRMGARRPAAVRGQSGRAAPVFRVPGATDHPAPALRAVRSSTRTALRRAREATLARVGEIFAPSAVPAGLRPSPTGDVRAALFEVGAFDPAPLVAAVAVALKAAPAKKALALVTGIAAPEHDLVAAFEPLEREPSIDLPLSRHVAEEDPRFIVPNVSGLPHDTVVLLEENRQFLAALMVGANDELNRELRWREAPISLSQTVLRRFWDRGAAWQQSGADDIDSITTWSTRLGDDFGDAAPRLVIAIKAELVRRYPELLVAVNRQQIPSNGRWKHDRGETFEPLFFGKLGSDVAYFGFDLTLTDLQQRLNETYVVIYEPPGRFRFGLDIASYARRAARANYAKTALPFATATLATQPRLATSATLQAVLTHEPAAVGPVPLNTDDLSWQHLVGKLLPSDYIDFSKQVAFADGDPAWGPSRNSASLARATRQKPLRAVLRASEIVPDGQ
jgi:hypothetical protein